MVATSGAKLISDDAVKLLTEKLFPVASLITPNIPETEALTGFTVSSKQDMENAAKNIRQVWLLGTCKGWPQCE